MAFVTRTRYTHACIIIEEYDTDSLRDQETALISLGELYRDEGYGVYFRIRDE